MVIFRPARADGPPEVFLEAGHDDDKQLPVARSADVVWVDRKNSWQALVKAVGSSAFEEIGRAHV